MYQQNDQPILMFPCQSPTKRLGSHTTQNSFCDHEHCACVNWILQFPTPFGTLASCYSPHSPLKIASNYAFHKLPSWNLISCITMDVNKVQDNLIMAKAFQAHYANTSHGREVEYNVGDHVMLSTFHQWRKREKNKQ